MGDVDAGLPQDADIVGQRIADQAMAGEIDGVRQDRLGIEHAFVGQQLDGRLAGPRHGLEELPMLLDEMHGEGNAERA